MYQNIAAPQIFDSHPSISTNLDVTMKWLSYYDPRSTSFRPYSSFSPSQTARIRRRSMLISWKN